MLRRRLPIEDRGFNFPLIVNLWSFVAGLFLGTAAGVIGAMSLIFFSIKTFCWGF